MSKENYRLKLIKDVKQPFEYFKGQNSKIVLLDGREYKGVLLKHSNYDIEFVTNVGTKDQPKKGTLIIHKSEIKYIIENNKGIRKTKKQD
ncbi:hypothetical protein [Staphylococcus equorum]|uniref:hypothetical protein n=1 Tax=Staphylococcus equorum TaxID=246432 RepID=UPI0018664232|nr:hypothetical protein [Staphylococcus equorum]